MSEYLWAFYLFAGMLSGFTLVFHSWRAFAYHTLLAALILLFMALGFIAKHTQTLAGWILRGLRYLQYGENAPEDEPLPKRQPVRPPARNPVPVTKPETDDIKFGTVKMGKEQKPSLSEDELERLFARNPDLKSPDRN